METGGIIYALLANNMAGLKIIYVSNPQNPILVGSIKTGEKARGVSTIKKGAKIYALLADYKKGLSIIDVSNP